MTRPTILALLAVLALTLGISLGGVAAGAWVAWWLA